MTLAWLHVDVAARPWGRPRLLLGGAAAQVGPGPTQMLRAALALLLALLLASTDAYRCAPPPRPPYPPAAALPNCTTFPDPFLKPEGGRVASGADWRAHRAEMIALIEHYMMGRSPPKPFLRSEAGGTAQLTEVCDRVSCEPVEATLRNFTLHVGPSQGKTQPFDVFVYAPKSAAGKHVPVFVYGGEGVYSGVDFGDLTAVGIRVLLGAFWEGVGVVRGICSV